MTSPHAVRGGSASLGHDRELEIVLAAAGVSGQGRIRDLLAGSDPEWTRVHEVARAHGVLPLLHASFAASPLLVGHFPEPFLSRLRDEAMRVVGSNVRLAAELVRVTDALENADIEAIAFKGPTLAARAYGSLGLRTYGDLDVLVRGRDVRRARRVLERMGFRGPPRRSTAGERALRRWGHHHNYLGPTSIALEVHWRFTNATFGSDLPEAAVWSSAERVAIGPGRVRVLRLEHELLVAVKHGAAHSWSHLKWVCDIDRLVRLAGAIDYREVASLAREIRCARAVGVALRLAEILLGTPLPIDARRLASGDPAIERGAALAIACLFGNATGVKQARLQLALRDSASDRARFALRALFLPTPGDLAWIELPVPLYPLYFVVRPFRMTAKYRPRLLEH